MMKELFNRLFKKKDTNHPIQKFLDADKFADSDLTQQIRPAISPVDYYRLHKMDFNWIILKPMSEAVTQHGEKNNLPLTEAIKITSPEQKLLYFWWYLDGQVTNGGFSQFIYNGYDKYFVTILNGLKLLNNKEYYTLVEKVFVYYVQHKMYALDRTKTDYFDDKFYENSVLSEADKQYFKINKQLYKDIELFIRNNIEKFVVPVQKDFTGVVSSAKDNITETLDVINGIPNGVYQKKVDNLLKSEILYKHGEITQTRKFSAGILTDEETIDSTDRSIKHIYTYYADGQVKEYSKRIYSDETNYDQVIRNRFYKTGEKKAEFWTDENDVSHIKRYFDDGDLRSYHTFKKPEDRPYGQITRYLVCFDENKNQTLIEGNGVFLDYDFEEDKMYAFYKTVIHCNHYLADGECFRYRNDIVQQKTFYTKGYEDGVQIEYDKNGNVESRKEFKNGTYIKTL